MIENFVVVRFVDENESWTSHKFDRVSIGEVYSVGTVGETCHGHHHHRHSLSRGND